MQWGITKLLTTRRHLRASSRHHRFDTSNFDLGEGSKLAHKLSTNKKPGDSCPQVRGRGGRRGRWAPRWL
jgi:hypothetical protein